MNLQSQRGLAVVMMALLLKEAPGERRDLAVMSLLGHLRDIGLDFQPAQLYLTAKSLLERPDLDLGIFPVDVQPLLAECQTLLQDYYPQFRDSPATQQLLGVLAEMNRLALEPDLNPDPTPGQPRELGARDVFGIADRHTKKETA